MLYSKTFILYSSNFSVLAVLYYLGQSIHHWLQSGDTNLTWKAAEDKESNGGTQ
jgi:hypothetical protein